MSVLGAAALCAAAELAGNHDVLASNSAQAWQAVLYLGIVATCLGFGVQAWAQCSLTTTTAAGVMSMETGLRGSDRARLWRVRARLARLGRRPAVVGGMALGEVGPRDCCHAMAPRVECC